MTHSFGVKKAGIIILGVLLFLPFTGCSTSHATQQNQPQGYPIDPNSVYTTRDRTVVAEPAPADSKITVLDVSEYESAGYGKWNFGPGLSPEKRFDLMPEDYGKKRAAVTNDSRLLNFFTFTDIHITDEESGNQLIYLGPVDGVSSMYSGVMLYTTQVLDCAVQTINVLHQKDAFDFGISIGDACNTTQYNELRWYIDVIDGKVIKPDSGINDDPVPGPLNDHQDEFKAAGLDKSIKFYQTLGNHDHFWIGTAPVDDYLGQFYTSDDILNMGNLLIDPLGINSRGYYMGSIDGRTVYGDVYGAGPVADFSTPPKLLAADSNRRPLSRKEWISEFFDTTSYPVGHGFSQFNIDTGFACYSFEPKANMPIKVIVLDDTMNENEPNVNGYGHTDIDRDRYEWLVKELDEGQAAGQLMIISAHSPLKVESPESVIGWNPQAYLTEDEFVAKLNTYPNLILWVAGHRHFNAVTPMESPSPEHPELGFWQVETSSLRDYPQQFRTFEIFFNSDKTLSIFAVDVDVAAKEGTPAAISRTYAVASQQFYKNGIGYLPTGSYNAELLMQLTPEMQEKLENYGTPVK